MSNDFDLGRIVSREWRGRAEILKETNAHLRAVNAQLVEACKAIISAYERACEEHYFGGMLDSALSDEMDLVYAALAAAEEAE